MQNTSFLQNLMVGDKHTRAHIWKIQIFRKKRGGGERIFSYFSYFCKILWLVIKSYESTYLLNSSFCKKTTNYARQIVTKLSTERKIWKNTEGRIFKNSEDQIFHLPQSTVLTYKRIFCNICEDLNFLSQDSNHII